MLTHTVYLLNYDAYNEVLEYNLPQGTFALLQRSEVEQRGLPLAFGNFAREGDHVAGVLATPHGPLFFLDDRQVEGVFGRTTATSEDEPNQPAQRRFTLIHAVPDKPAIQFTLLYRERYGLGANPYDNEIEDIDLFALIASGIRHKQFFRNFTRNWVD